MSVHSDRRRKARLAAAAAAGLGGLAVIRSVFPAGTPPIRVKDKVSAERARPIATLEKVRLGGSDQWVLERSDDVRNPVLLYLHGYHGAVPPMALIALFAQMARSTNRSTPHHGDYRMPATERYRRQAA